MVKLVPGLINFNLVSQPFGSGCFVSEQSLLSGTLLEYYDCSADLAVTLSLLSLKDIT